MEAQAFIVVEPAVWLRGLERVRKRDMKLQPLCRTVYAHLMSIVPSRLSSIDTVRVGRVYSISYAQCCWTSCSHSEVKLLPRPTPENLKMADRSAS